MLDGDTCRADFRVISTRTTRGQGHRVGARLSVSMRWVQFGRGRPVTEVPRQAADFTRGSIREGHGQIVDPTRRGGCEPCHRSRMLDGDTCRADSVSSPPGPLAVKDTV